MDISRALRNNANERVIFNMAKYSAVSKVSFSRVSLTFILTFPRVLLKTNANILKLYTFNFSFIFKNENIKIN